jgi:hypothetical protein
MKDGRSGGIDSKGSVNMKAIKGTLCVILTCGVVFTASAFGQDRILTMHDVNSDLGRLIGNTPLDFVREAEIAYGHLGNSSYDDFFRSSAIAYGGMVVGQGLTEDATLNVKAYARSKVAVAALQDQIMELTEGADTASWTVEQSFAILRAAEMEDELSGEERSYLASTAVNIVALIPVIEASVSSSADLMGQTSGLVSGARSAFGMRRAGGVARNVGRSGDRISDVPTEGASLLEQLVVLTNGFAMLSSIGDGG